MRPILTPWTRSFWFGILPEILVVLEVAFQIIAALALEPGLMPPVARLIGWMIGGDPAVIEGGCGGSLRSLPC